MAVRTDAAATILVSTEGYVRRFVTLTANGLTVPTPVKRLNIQEPVKILLRTELRNQENTSSLILRTKCFLFSATWIQSQNLFGR